MRRAAGSAAVIGWEALIVLQDLRGLTPDEQAEISTWAARALIQAALLDQPETSRAGNQRPPTQQASPSPHLRGDPTAGPALRPRLGNPLASLARKFACRVLCTNLWMAVDGLCRTASSLCTIGVKRWIRKIG